MNEFEQEIVLEYTQSETVSEAKSKAISDYSSGLNALNLEKGLNSYVARKAIAAADAIKNAADNAVETRVYSIPDDAENPTVASDCYRAIFRVKTYGATVIKIRPDFPATVILFRYNRHLLGSNTRTQIAAFSLAPKAASSGSSQWGETTVYLTSAADCKGENEYLISVWQDGSGDIACCAGSNIDRMEHSLGGIWAPYASSPDPENGDIASFIWYVPAAHISSLVDTIDQLDDSSIFDTIMNGVVAGISMGVAALNTYENKAVGWVSSKFSGWKVIGKHVSDYGKNALKFISKFGAGKKAIIFALAAGAAGFGIAGIDSLLEFKENLKKEIRKVASKDGLSLSYSAYAHGIKLTIYDEEMNNYSVTPWDSGIMEGALGCVGTFFPGSDNHSEFTLVAYILDDLTEDAVNETTSNAEVSQ